MTTATRAKNRAPGPKGAPLLGSLGPWKRNTAEFLLGLQRDYGEIVRMQLGPFTVHQVTEPEAVRRVLVENNGNYVRGPLYEQFRVVMGKGLLTTDGEFWRGHRRAVQPVFLKNAVADIIPNLVQATNEMLEGWERKAAAGEPVDLMTDMLKLTLVTLSRSLFAYDINPSTALLKTIVDDVVEVMFRRGVPSEMLPSWVPTERKRKITRIHRAFDRVVADVRRQYAQTGEGPLIGLMEQAADPETGRPWTAQQIKDELLTVYLAGHETTAVALCWTLLSVAHHPHVQEELDAEIATVLGGAPPDAATAESLTYTKMVVDESLRMHPPIWIFPRAAVEPDELGGYDVDAGDSILLSPLVSHHNPRHWDNPLAFDPYRFTPQAVKERPRMAYLPFGSGPRQCVGNFMALLELRVIVAMINQRFRLSRVPGDSLQYGSPVISLRPVKDVMVTVRARERGTAVPAARPAAHPAGSAAPLSCPHTGS
ncbi:cytochrome P450 [Streptomyces sp. B1866]|uniref:cytochrome P450 n=1 Tax=Streptomyces sp. B1866 TaxID=3075431 RepID=UPI00288F652A|nr:cytochrome P450 [Streptomyces sp. B1866]MDT3395894.1 cytochrome P450 [Streptomyces sp. B1866]